MKRRARVVALVVVVLSATGVLSACGSSGSTRSATVSARTANASAGGKQGDLVIGLAMAKTGVINFYDGPVIQGIQMAVDQLNAQGGVAGRKLKVISVDTHSQVSNAATAAEQLISQGANVIWTSSDAGFGGPAAQVANQRGIVALGAVGGVTFGLQGMGKQVFNVYQGNATEGAMLTQATLQEGWNHLYLLEDTSLEYTQQICKFVQKDRGGSAISGFDTFAQTDQSIASQISRLKGTKNVDAIVLCSYPPGGASALRQIRAAGINLPVLTPATFDGSFWTKAVPNVSNVYNSSVASMYGDDPRPAVNQFFATYRKQFGANPPIAYPALGYSGVQLIAKALQATGGDTNGVKLAHAIEGFRNVDNLLGPTSYSSTCHAPLGRGLALIRWTGGKARMVSFITPKNVPRIGC